MSLLWAILLVLSVVSYATSNYKRVCYFTNWAQYRNGAGKFKVTDIDPFLCTHVIYAFAKVEGNEIKPYEWNDLSTEWSKGQYEKTMNLKTINPNLWIMLAIGGWNHGSEPFTTMVSSQTNIDQFATNSLNFLRSNGFDGLDLDWEYPANRGSPPEDKQRFTSLIMTLRAKFDADEHTSGKSRLLLTAAVSAGKTTVDTAYEINKISQYLDFINLMSYDFNGGMTVTGHNSPLYSAGPPNPDFCTDFAVKLWLNGGTPKHKLILGLATYGRSYTLKNLDSTGLGSPATGAGKAGPFTVSDGFLAYYEICSFIKTKGWAEVWLDEQKVPYAYKDDQWVGYDNLRSIEIKTQYIISNGLGGAMVWAMDLDDFNGTCGLGNNPLMNKVKALFDGKPGPVMSNTTGTIDAQSKLPTTGKTLSETISSTITPSTLSRSDIPLPTRSLLITSKTQADDSCTTLKVFLAIFVIITACLIVYILHLKGFLSQLFDAIVLKYHAIRNRTERSEFVEPKPDKPRPEIRIIYPMDSDDDGFNNISVYKNNFANEINKTNPESTVSSITPNYDMPHDNSDQRNYSQLDSQTQQGTSSPSRLPPIRIPPSRPPPQLPSKPAI